MDVSSFDVHTMPLTRKHIAGGFAFLIFAPAIVAIVLCTSGAFIPISFILIVSACYIRTIVLSSSLVRSVKSFVHLYLNSSTSFSCVGTFTMLSSNVTVPRSETTLEASSCTLGFAVRIAYKRDGEVISK